MPRAKTVFVIVCVVAIIAAAGALLWPRWSAQTSAPSATAAGLSLYGYTEDSLLTWHVTAESGTLVDDGGTLYGIELAFSEDTSDSTVVRADELARTSDESVLTGNIQVKREDGLYLTTSRITWNEGDETLVASQTDLHYDDIHASGRRFAYDLAAGDATLAEQVFVMADGEDGWQLTSEMLRVTEQVLMATGGVEVETEDAERYICDRLEYDMETKEISMTGGVDLAFSSGHITAENVSVTADGFTATSGVTLRMDLVSETGDNG